MFQHSYIGPRTIAEKHSSIAMHYGYGLGILEIVHKLTNPCHKAVHLFNRIALILDVSNSSFFTII